MGAKEHRKGRYFERMLVKLFRSYGLDAVRVPLSGSAEGFKGDILLEDMRVELKVRRVGFQQLYKWLENNDLLVVKADRKPFLVVIPVERFANILRRCKYGSSREMDEDNTGDS